MGGRAHGHRRAPDCPVNRVFAWADALQRRHGVLGFPYAVVKKYGDDEGGRQAALITYYGFLSIFPLLLLGVAILSRVLVANPDLRQRLVGAIVPPVLQPTVDHALTTLPSSTVPLIAGLIGLLFSGTGIAFSAYQTLNNVAAVPRRVRFGFIPRYVRVFVMLVTLMLGVLAVGRSPWRRRRCPAQPGLERVAGTLGSRRDHLRRAAARRQAAARAARAVPCRVAGGRPGCGGGGGAARHRATPAGADSSAARARLRQLRHGGRPVRGLYLISQALVYAAEVAAVRYARLWPSALDQTRPTAADVRAPDPARARAGTVPGGPGRAAHGAGR